MPFALVFIGLIMIVTGAKGTHAALGKQLVSDFTGPGNFFYWIAAVGTLGALGAIPGFKPFSRMFMTLVIVAMVIRNGGVFDKLIAAIKSGPIAPAREGSSKAGGNPSVQSGANDLRGTIDATLSSVTQFRQSSTPAASNPVQNFRTTLGLITKFL